jgi:nitroimidazol reductase NimA-like FMN-containing flavoprotein (pyridoxamine 5'-phosphate oxidase superfamily)
MLVKVDLGYILISPIMDGTWMRRTDREITDRAVMEEIISEALVCRIGLSGRNGPDIVPYVVPVCFGYEDGVFYIHSAPEGKKMRLIGESPACCIEVDLCDGVVRGEKACSWGMRYRSVIATGTAALVDDPGEKKHGLNVIMQHYQGGQHDFTDREVAGVAVIRIRVEEMSGKMGG